MAAKAQIDALASVMAMVGSAYLGVGSSAKPRQRSKVHLLHRTCSPPAPKVRCGQEQLQRTPHRGAVHQTLRVVFLGCTALT